MASAQWYRIKPGSDIDTNADKLSDGDHTTCPIFHIATSSKLVRATLTETYTSLEVRVQVKELYNRGLNFGPAQPNCDEAPSLLMTHDSSKSIADGLTCNPFCQAPKPCQLGNVTRDTRKFNYQFLCQCAFPTCNDLFLLLRPVTYRHAVKICEITIVDNWSRETPVGTNHCLSLSMNPLSISSFWDLAVQCSPFVHYVGFIVQYCAPQRAVI